MGDDRAATVTGRGQRERDWLTVDALLERAAAAGLPLSARTVTYYVSEGLLPAPVRAPFEGADGRARYFPLASLERLRRVHELKTRGFSLVQIRRLASGEGAPELRALSGDAAPELRALSGEGAPELRALSGDRSSQTPSEGDPAFASSPDVPGPALPGGQLLDVSPPGRPLEEIAGPASSLGTPDDTSTRRLSDDLPPAAGSSSSPRPASADEARLISARRMLKTLASEDLRRREVELRARLAASELDPADALAAWCRAVLAPVFGDQESGRFVDAFLRSASRRERERLMAPLVRASASPSARVPGIFRLARAIAGALAVRRRDRAEVERLLEAAVAHVEAVRIRHLDLRPVAAEEEIRRTLLRGLDLYLSCFRELRENLETRSRESVKAALARAEQACAVLQALEEIVRARLRLAEALGGGGSAE